MILNNESITDSVFFAVVGQNGEVLIIYNISRYCEDLYECVAVNGIPPAASKEIKVVVECKIYGILKLYFNHITYKTNYKIILRN